MVTRVFGLDATGGEAVPSEVVDDTSPELGGDMSLNGFDLLSLAASGPSMLDETATGINPVFIPRRSDETTGVGSGGIGNLSMIANGTEVFDILSTTTIFNGTALRGGVTNSWQLQNVGASATVPTLIHNRSSTTSGIGGVAGDTSLIVNGLEILRAEPTLVTFFQDMQATIAGGPAIVNETATASNPTLIPDRGSLSTGIGADAGELSFINEGIESLRIDASGAVQLRQVGGDFRGSNANAPSFNNVAATATVPTLVPNRSGSTTGLGGVAGTASLIGAGVERISVNATGIGFFATAPVARPTGVTVDAAGIHAALVTLGLITA